MLGAAATWKRGRGISRRSCGGFSMYSCGGAVGRGEFGKGPPGV